MRTNPLPWMSIPHKSLARGATMVIALMGIVAPRAEAYDYNPPWQWLGPAPIPNGQTVSQSDAISGRVTVITVHPTNPNIAYVGTAQGGIYRTLDGGASWTQLFDGASTLVIGSLTLAPSDSTTLFVGTGEPYNNADGYYGNGVYIITNADTNPIVTGPFNKDSAGADVFGGNAISRILVSSTDSNVVLVSTNSAIAGIGKEFKVSANQGIYLSKNALSASPTFSPLLTGDVSVFDMAADPSDLNNLVFATSNGLYTFSNAVSGSASATKTFTPTNAFGLVRFAMNKIGSTITLVAATDETQVVGQDGQGNPITADGTLRLASYDGSNWTPWSNPVTAANGFADGQAFYDIGVAIDPTTTNNIYIGGSASSTTKKSVIFSYSTNGGSTFTKSEVGLHSDTHAIAVAPSNPSVIYFGCDGGIWKSSDSGQNWTSLNNSTFSATQFQGIALHPTDRNFMIGGTQDNGTEYFDPSGGWTRIEDGDAGYCLIDQNATDTTNVRFYSTRYNKRSSLIGFYRGDAINGAYTFHGYNSGFNNGNGGSNNGISGSDKVTFYAPMALGPGNPNRLYFGTDRLYRSTDGGDSMSVISQAPLDPTVKDASIGSPISCIAISPQNDNVRIVGLANGKVFATNNASATLTDISGPIPARYIGRIAIDPQDVKTAYVAVAAPGLTAGRNVWKTTNLDNAAPIWTASGTGIPSIPVNAFVVDPQDSTMLYAGTDDGVYVSRDSGASWSRFGTGFPHVAVFDLAFQQQNRFLRAATHGRGVYEILPDPPHIKPLIAVTSPAQNALLNAFPTITGTASDKSGTGLKDNQVSFTIFHDGQYWNGTAWQDGQIALHANVGPSGNWSYSETGMSPFSGLIAISASVVDNVGNISEAIGGSNPNPNQIIFHLDMDPPTISLQLSPGGDTITAGALPNNWISGLASDAEGAVGVTIYFRRVSDGEYWDGKHWDAVVGNSALAGTINPDGTWRLLAHLPQPGMSTYFCLPNGQYTITAIAQDLAGNKTQTSTNITVNYHPTYGLTAFNPDETAPIAPDTVPTPTELARSTALDGSSDPRTQRPAILRTDPAGNFYVGTGMAHYVGNGNSEINYPSAVIQKENGWRLERQQSSVTDNTDPLHPVTHYFETWGSQTFEVPESTYNTWIGLSGMEVDSQGSVYAAFTVFTLQQTYWIDSSGGVHYYDAPNYSDRVQVMKFDTNGSMVWRTFAVGALPSTTLQSMKLASDGSVALLLLNYYSVSNPYGSSYSQLQTMVARIPANGGGGFVSFFGYTGQAPAAIYSSTPRLLAVDQQGNTLVASEDGLDGIDSPGLNVLRKIAPGGSVAAQAEVGYCSGDTSWGALETDANGNVYIASGSFEVSSNDYRQSLLKFDSNLNQLWRALAPPNTDAFFAGLQISASGVTVVGTISGNNVADQWVISRFAPDGTMLWARQGIFGSVQKFVLDANEDVLIFGTLSQPDGTNRYAYGKIAQNGDMQFAKQLTPPGTVSDFILQKNDKPAALSQDNTTTEAVILSFDNPAVVKIPVSLDANTPADVTALIGTSTTLSVINHGSPGTYQWQKFDSNGTPQNIPGATSATYKIDNGQATDSGKYQVVVTNAISSATSRVANVVFYQLVPLADALNPAFTWTTSSNSPWFGQTGTATDSNGAAQSGSVTNGGRSWIQTTVTGPGTLRFKWKVSGSGYSDYLYVYLDPTDNSDGTQIAWITPDQDWIDQSVSIPDGTHVVRWVMQGAFFGSGGTGWIDQVTLGATQPLSIVFDISDRTVRVNDFAYFYAYVTGDDPHYQWYKDSTPIVGATDASLYFFSAQISDAGYYHVVVTNAVSTVSSRTAHLTVEGGIYDWRGTYFPDPNAPEAAAGADPSHSGIINLMAYALGMDPFHQDRSLLPQIGKQGGSGNHPISTGAQNFYLTLSFHRVEPSDLDYIVEGSFDLKIWTPVATFAAGGNSWTGPGTVTETGSGATRSVTVQDNVSSQSTSKRFLRLKVNQP